MDSHLIILGNRIRHLRKDNDLTQKELSSMIGLTPKMISFYENNQRIPPADILIKFAKIFNVTVDYLLGSPSSDDMERSIEELNLLKYYRDKSNNPNQKSSPDSISNFFPGAVYLKEEEWELIQYYTELSLKDRRWIMGQMINLIKKSNEKQTKLPKAQ